jgi:hypothetical protein
MGTCGVGCREVCTRGVDEAGVVGRRSVHAGNETNPGLPGDEVSRVESGGDEPRGDALQRVDEEVNAAQLQWVAKLNTPCSTAKLELFENIGAGFDR